MCVCVCKTTNNTNVSSSMAKLLKLVGLEGVQELQLGNSALDECFHVFSSPFI